MAQFDLNKFNTDPKHQEQRDFLDGIVEASAKRLYERAKKSEKKEEANMFDAVFGGIFGGGEEK